MIILTETVIKPDAIYEQIKKNTAGSVVFHFAVVRERTGDQITNSIDFQSIGDTEDELESISENLKEKWNLEDVLIIRRLGILRVGDIISLVAASSSHRHDAFEACMHGVECLKKMKTIRKTEQ